MTHSGLIILIIIIAAINYSSKSTERKFDNYRTPEGYQIDYNAQLLDKAKNNLTVNQVMENTINGKYNVKK